MASRGRGWEVALFLDRSEMNGDGGRPSRPTQPHIIHPRPYWSWLAFLRLMLIGESGQYPQGK